MGPPHGEAPRHRCNLTEWLSWPALAEMFQTCSHLFLLVGRCCGCWACPPRFYTHPSRTSIPHTPSRRAYARKGMHFFLRCVRDVFVSRVLVKKGPGTDSGGRARRKGASHLRFHLGFHPYLLFLLFPFTEHLPTRLANTTTLLGPTAGPRTETCRRRFFFVFFFRFRFPFS